MQYLRPAFPNTEQRTLLARKGFYPYDHMDSMERFNETSLPSKAQFYNRLNEEHITDADYAHTENVWRTFNCQTMRDYHDLYLRTDVLLLADVFEKFRTMDPVHYYSLPALAWDAALKFIIVNIDLIVDIDMYQLVRRGLRGGISMI